MLIMFLALLFFWCPTSMAAPDCLQFNWGDSNTDTGGYYCGVLGTIVPPEIPYSCRASNCRLYIDYLGESLGSGPLPPYMDPLHWNFSVRLNFAIWGMTARPKPGFPLTIQVNQFNYFVHHALENPKGKGPNINQDGIRNAIFSIDIGQNDVNGLLLSSPQEIQGNISEALANVEKAIRRLYDLGGRKFLLYNTGPIGCLPFKLTNKKLQDGPRDRVGCLIHPNNIAQRYNNRLRLLSTTLQQQLTGAIIVYVNMFDIKYDIIANAMHFGFENPVGQCQKGGNVCPNPNKTISWDGSHYTDAANKVIASMVYLVSN